MSEIDPTNARVDALISQDRPPIDAIVKSTSDLQVLRGRWAANEAQPVLIHDRGEGDDHSWAGLNIRTLLRGEQSAGQFSAHSITLAPGDALPLHFHEYTHTYLIVLSGAPEIRVGHVSQEADAYSVATAPPLTHQSIRNRSDHEVTILMVCSPAGMDRAFSDAHVHWLQTEDPQVSSYIDVLKPYGIRFEAQRLKNDARTNAEVDRLDLVIEKEGDLETLRAAFAAREAVPLLLHTPESEFATQAAGATFRKEVFSGDQTAGRAMMNLLSAAPDMVVQPHYQPSEEEFFVIAEGRLQMTCGETSTVLTKGGFAFCPRNCTHAFANASPEGMTRFFTINAPAGHERAMASVRKRMNEGATTPAQIRELARIGGFIFHGPSDAPIAGPAKR